jgi:hypothetical protein
MENLIYNQEEGQHRKEDENSKPKRSRLETIHLKSLLSGFRDRVG